MSVSPTVSNGRFATTGPYSPASGNATQWPTVVPVITASAKLVDVYEGKPVSDGGLPVVANRLAAPSDGRSAIQKRLDAFFDAYHSEYRFNFQGTEIWVEVPAHFRRNYKIREGYSEAMRGREVLRAAFDEHGLWPSKKSERDLWIQRINRVAMGRGTPTDVKHLTQKLLDAGLAPADATNPSEAVRILMWQYCIGVDCIGYVAQALAAGANQTMSSLGTAGIIQRGDGIYPKRNSNLREVQLLDTQPGDLISLTSVPPGGSGHNVVVYATGPFEMTEEITTTFQSDKQWAFASGRIRYFDVDSSWGASGSATSTMGGVKRRTWLYNEDTKQWAELRTEPYRLQLSTESGPYDHALGGVFRPK